MTVAELLRSARSYVVKGWCQNVAARTRAGRPVAPRNAEAARWCAMGAIAAACPNTPGLGRARRHAHRRLRDAVGARVPAGIALWNDERGRRKAHVLAAFDRAISPPRKRARSGKA